MSKQPIILLYNLQHQTGLALPMTLIMLLVMTILGVSSLRLTTLDEEMVTNNRLREIAFNAAESTLAYAEADAINDLTSGELRQKLFVNNSSPSTTGSAEPGDSCTDGYCSPAKFDNSGDTTLDERWVDLSLDVWNDTDKHMTYGNYNSSSLEEKGVLSAPKYIIEYVGHFYQDGNKELSACWDTSTGDWEAGYTDEWPYCTKDAGLIRITAMATAGSAEKGSTVMLQSTIEIN